MNVLIFIAARGPIAPHQVAKELGFEKSTLSRNVRILEDNGWIDSRPADSGKVLLLRIKPAGRKLVRRAGPSWQAAQEQVTSLLGEGTTAAIRRACDRVQQLEMTS